MRKYLLSSKDIIYSAQFQKLSAVRRTQLMFKFLQLPMSACNDEYMVYNNNISIREMISPSIYHHYGQIIILDIEPGSANISREIGKIV